MRKIVAKFVEESAKTAAPEKKAVKKKVDSVISEAEKVVADTLKALGKSKVLAKGLALQTQDSIHTTKDGASIFYTKGSTEKKPLVKLTDNGSNVATALKGLGYKATKETRSQGTTLIKVLKKSDGLTVYVKFAISSARGKYYVDCSVNCMVSTQALLNDERFNKDILKLVRKYLG